MPYKAKSTNDNREKLINRTVSKFKNFLGNSLVFQSSGLCTFTAVAQVQSLITELRSPASCEVWPKKKIWSLKDTIKKIKRQTTDWKKILATISDKELVSRPYEDSYSPIIRKQITQLKNWTKNLNRH